MCVSRGRREVTEVYGELSDVDSVDWMKIANVDVRRSSSHSYIKQHSAVPRGTVRHSAALDGMLTRAVCACHMSGLLPTSVSVSQLVV